jgi:pentatricopeptide repeat protein
MLRGGLFPIISTPTYNCLHAGLCAQGDNMTQAVVLYRRMVKIGIRGKKCVVLRFLNRSVPHGDGHTGSKAEVLFGDMLVVRCSLNVVTCTAFVKGFCAFGQVHHARNMMQHMASIGIVANVVTYTLSSVSVSKGEQANQLGSMECVKKEGLIFVAEWRRKNCVNRISAYNV